MEADALSGIDWEKCDETIQANSIQTIVAAVIAGNVANHIETVPCSPQTIDFILTSVPNTPVISNAITQSSGQNHPTHLESELSELNTVSNPDNSSHPGFDTGHSLNPKCMTISDWIEAQSQDKTIGAVIRLFKVEEFQCQKGKETDSHEMRQLIRQ